MEKLAGWMIHVLGETEQEGMKFYHTTQNSKQFQIYELFISGAFYLMFLEHD